MSTCRICAKLRRWLGIEEELTCETILQSHWNQSDDWEREHSNDAELWWRDSDRNRALIHEAWERQDTDPDGAFGLFVEAAEAGSPRAMETVGSFYETGIVKTADFDRAANQYYRAVCAGSWMATIAYARLLAAHGDIDECEAVLRDGVELNFVPAYFWLAWLRYQRTPTRATCRAIRPLLDYAANQVIRVRRRCSER